MGYLRQLQANDDSRAEALRALGGLLFGIGMLVLLLRRSTFEDPWGDFVVFVSLLIPALVLYGGGLAAARAATPKHWHSVWVVFGIVFIYATLRQFLELIDANAEAPLNVAWTVGVVAAAGAAAAVFAGVRFGWLVAGVALVIVWLSLWDQILENGVGDDIGTFRGLCMIAALGLVVLGAVIERRGREGIEAAEFVTAAGLVFVLGAGLVSLAGVFSGLFVPVDVGASGAAEGQPSLLWDLVLLVGSVALIGAGSLVGSRGPVYIGGAGLAVFILLVGGDLDDDSPAGSVVGWPLILLGLAGVAIAASVFGGRSQAGNQVGDQDPAP